MVRIYFLKSGSISLKFDCLESGNLVTLAACAWAERRSKTGSRRWNEVGSRGARTGRADRQRGESGGNLKGTRRFSWNQPAGVRCGKILRHGCPCRFHVTPRHVHLASPELPCFAIVSGLRVIALFRAKRGSRPGPQQTPHSIRAYGVADTRRVLAQHSVLAFTIKRRLSLGRRQA